MKTESKKERKSGPFSWPTLKPTLRHGCRGYGHVFLASNGLFCGSCCEKLARDFVIPGEHGLKGEA